MGDFTQRRRRRRLTAHLWLVFTPLAMTAWLAMPQLVLADCDGPFPDFRELAKTAKAIVIGDVVAVERGGAWDPADGLSSTLQIVHVLRGASEAVVKIEDMPTTQCAPVIGARVGDRIAIAYDGAAFNRGSGVNMVAWIDAVPPPGFNDPMGRRAESLSLDDAFALTGQVVPPPPSFDTSHPAAVVPETPVNAAILAGLVAALLVTALAFTVAVRRRRIE